MFKSGPITLSLTEIGIDLLFVVLILLMISKETSRRREEECSNNKNKLEYQLAKTENHIGILETNVVDLSIGKGALNDECAEIKSKYDELRSKIYPTCPGGPILDIHILSEDLIEIAGLSYNFLDFKNKFESKRSEGLANRTVDGKPHIPCIYSVIARFSNKLSVEAFNNALEIIEALFRPQRRISRQ